MFWVNNRRQPPRRFQLGELAVGGVGPGFGPDHLFPVKAVKALGIPHKVAVAENRLGRQVESLMVKPVDTAEIRDSGFGAHPRAAEKYDAAALIDHLLKPFFLIFHLIHSSTG